MQPQLVFRMLRPALAFAWFLVCTSQGRAAHAAGDPLGFWGGPSECAAPNLRVPSGFRVTVRLQRGRWLAWIKDNDGEGGERLLVGESCAEITRAVGLTISLLGAIPAPLTAEGEFTPSVPASVVSRAEEVPGAEPPSAEPLNAAALEDGPLPPVELAIPEPFVDRPTQSQPRPLPQVEVEAAVEPRPTQSWSGTGTRAALLGGTLFDGTSSSVAGEVLLSNDFAAWTLLGELRFALGTFDGGVRLELQTAEVGVSGCRRWQKSVTVLACAGVVLEALRATAPLVAHPNADASLLPGATLGLALRAPLSERAGVLAVLGALERLRGAQFFVEPVGLVHTLPRTGFSFLAGPELQF